MRRWAKAGGEAGGRVGRRVAAAHGWVGWMHASRIAPLAHPPTHHPHRWPSQVTYDLRLARFYMWAQTDLTVFLACRVPTGARALLLPLPPPRFCCRLTPTCLTPPNHPPTGPGYEDKQLVVECSARGLLVQSQDSPPLIDRLWAEHGVDGGRPVETFRCLGAGLLQVAWSWQPPCEQATGTPPILAPTA